MFLITSTHFWNKLKNRAEQLKYVCFSNALLLFFTAIEKYSKQISNTKL